MILAILKAQFLSMRLRPGTRKGSAIFSAITGLMFYAAFVFLGWMTMLFFSSGDQTPLFVTILSLGLPFVMLYWQLSPLISASFGASLDLQKLRAYPIPKRSLFIVEVMLRVTTCAELLLPLLGLTVGLLRNPMLGWRYSPLIIGGTVIFAATNVLLSAGTRSLLERLILRTKLRELLMILLVTIAVLPQILLATKIRKGTVLGLAPSQIVWPWAAIAHLVTGDSALLASVSALFWLGVAAVFSRWQFERTLKYDGAAIRKPEREAKPDGVMEKFYRLPGRLLPDPLAAMMEKELRTYFRIPRFRVVYAMSCFFGVIVFLPMMRRGQQGFFRENALPVMCLYGLMMLGQISYWNAFGFDRSAVQGYFSWPVKFRDVLIAKNLTVWAMLAPQVLVVSVVCWIAKLGAGPGKIVETLFVVAVSSLYWFSLGNICSVRIPRAMNPDKMNQMTNKLQALTIFAAPFLLLPVVLAYWSRWFFESETIFVAVMAVAAIVGAIFYWVGLDSAVEAATGEKREKMLLELTKSDGPMSIT